MAIINGVELKSVKEGYGHERNGLEASIYLDGKKVGDVYNDGVGGCNGYYWGVMKNGKFVHNDAEQVITERMDAFYKGCSEGIPKFEAIDSFIEQILELKWIEKQFTSMIKKGQFKVVTFAPSKYYDDGRYEQSICIQAMTVADAEKAMKENGRTNFRFYTQTSDFIVNTGIFPQVVTIEKVVK